MSRVQSELEAAYDKIKPNVDPREDQGVQEVIRKLDDARQAEMQKYIPKPNVDPFPPDFVTAEAPYNEVKFKIKGDVDPLPPDVLPPPEPVSPPPPPEIVAARNEPKQPSQETPRLPAQQSKPDKDETPQNKSARSWGNSSSLQPNSSELDRAAVYCNFDFKDIQQRFGRPEQLAVIVRSLVTQETAEFRSMVNDFRTQVVFNTYFRPDEGLQFLQSNSVRFRGKQIVVLEPWYTQINNIKLETESFYGELLSERHLLVGLNSFVLHDNAINFLPDYEAIGTMLAEALERLKAKSVVVVLPKQAELLGTVSIIIESARRKLSVPVKQAETTELSREVEAASKFDQTAFIYMRKPGQDSQGRNVPDVDESVAERLLKANGSKLIFAAMGASGYILKSSDSAGQISVQKEGLFKGLSYWSAPVQAIIRQFFKDVGSPPPLPVKALDNKTYPLIAEFLGSKAKAGSRKNVNACVFRG